jgi:hypothetical protein
MWNYVADYIGITDNVEIEPPIPIDPRLPSASGFIIFLGLQGGMAQVPFQKYNLFEKRLAYLYRRFC